MVFSAFCGLSEVQASLYLTGLTISSSVATVTKDKMEYDNIDVAVLYYEA